MATPARSKSVPKPSRKSLRIKLIMALINLSAKITAPAIIRYIPICLTSIIPPNYIIMIIEYT